MTQTKRRYCSEIPERKNKNLLSVDVDNALSYLYCSEGNELDDTIDFLIAKAKQNNMSVMEYIVTHYKKDNNDNIKLNKTIELFVKELVNLHNWNVEINALPELKPLKITNIEKQRLKNIESEFSVLINKIMGFV